MSFVKNKVYLKMARRKTTKCELKSIYVMGDFFFSVISCLFNVVTLLLYRKNKLITKWGEESTFENFDQI